MAKLIVRSEDGLEEEFSLDSGSLTIGRSPDCEITIDDTQASRRHCSVIRLKSGAWELADLGSTNGTLLNSVLVKRQKMNHGDVIRIGQTEITLDDAGAAAGPTEIGNCTLVYAKGDKMGAKIELTEQRTTLGRKESNTVTLSDGNASSYHCEVVRALNGYTIRDLGSTNGTLVNNEMITEAPLVHGARIRIGSTRFVFQDPAMADIDLELAGVDDDEADWGMMRELDLAAVRKRNPAVLVYALLFLAVVGGLVYLVQFKEAEKQRGGPTRPDSLLDAYAFDTEAEAYLWDAEPFGAAEISWNRGKWVEFKVTANAADIVYTEARELDNGPRRFTLKGKLGSKGAPARLGLRWSGLGLSRMKLSESVTGAPKAVTVTGGAPPWAARVEVVVHIEGAGQARLDDLTLVDIGPSRPKVMEPGSFRIVIVDDADIDLYHLHAPILIHGAAVADGRPAPEAKVTAEVKEKQVIITVEGPGSMIGLRFVEHGGYLTRGGYRGFGYKEDSTDPYFESGFPEDGLRTDDRIRKLLVGEPGRALAILPVTEDARLVSICDNRGPQRTWTVQGPAANGRFRFRIKTDLAGESAEAARRMAEAQGLYHDGRWGEFLVAAQRALAEFPFGERTIRARLGGYIAEVMREYLALAREAGVLLADYEEFRDLQSLDRVREILRIWHEKYQVKPGEGQRGRDYAEIDEKEKALRGEALQKAQTQRASAFFEQAVLVHILEEEFYSAAVMLTYILEWLPESAQAKATPQQRDGEEIVEDAPRELAVIAKDRPDILKVLKTLGLGRGR